MYRVKGLFLSLIVLISIAALTAMGTIALSALPAPASPNAVKFDGVDDRISFGNTLATGNPTFTLETWLMREGPGRTARSGLTPAGVLAVPVITKGVGSASADVNYFLGIDQTTQLLVADFQDLGGLNHPVTGKTRLWPGVWYHVAAVYDGTTWRLFVNGQLDNELVVGGFTPQFASTQFAGLGAAFNAAGAATGNFQGQLDEVRIWSTARTEAEIHDNMGAPLMSGDGLVGRFGFDDGTANSSVASTPPVNGSLMGGVFIGPPGAPATPSPSPGPYGLHLSGTPPGNEYVALDPATVPGLTTFTIETWFKREGAGQTTNTGAFNAIPLVTKGREQAGSEGNNLDLNYFLGISPTGGPSGNPVVAADFEDLTGANHPLLGHTTVVNNAWYHVAVTYDGSSYALYLDGVLEASGTLSGATPRSDSIQRPAIGSAVTATNQAAGFLNGSVDEVRIWNVARTHAQVQSGRNRQITSASGLVARWSFNEWGGPAFVFKSEPNSQIGTITGVATATPLWNWMLVSGAPMTGATNKAPLVSAGTDQTIAFGSPASLNGSVEDDNVPTGGAGLTIDWTKASGPGTVTFADTHSASTTATFSERGTYVLTLSADDGETSASDQVTISVESRPAAVDDSYSVNEDTTLTVAAPGVLANDTDADGNALQAVVVSGPAHGALALSANGGFTYEPAANFSGADSFTYKATHHGIDSNVATVSITVNPVNDVPVAAAGTLTTTEDTPASGTLSASDADADPLTYSIVTNGAKGTATITNPASGAFSYTPNADANGADTFTFKANDGTSDSNVATVTVTITSANDAPVAHNGTLATNEDTAAGGTLSASDADGDALTYSIVSNGSKGSASITNAATGAYTYTPNADANGTDTFTFKANDGTSDSTVATVTVTINAVNDAPVARNGTITTNEDTPASGTVSATDADGNPLVYSIVSNGAKGTATITNPATGAFTYTPNADANGSDAFTFKASDGTSDSNVATIAVTINAVNDPPKADNQSVSTAQNTPRTIALTGSDPEGTTLTYVIKNGPSDGTLSGAAPNLTYTPAAGYSGTDSFTFAVRDSDGAESGAATVSITVTPLSGAPKAFNQSVKVDEDRVVLIYLPANDPDHDRLRYTIDSEPEHGRLLHGPLPWVIYIPDTNYNGSDRFTFHASDRKTDSNTATVSITVKPVNDEPLASNLRFVTAKKTPLTAQLVGSDIDGDTLKFRLKSKPDKGTVTLNPATGVFTYTPNANASGDDDFAYVVNDGNDDSDTATVRITIRNPVVDKPPVASNIQLENSRQTAISGKLVATDEDDDDAVGKWVTW
jgi:VCBS repeat-containing protein